MKNTFLKSLALTLALLMAGTAGADVKLRTKNTMAGHSSESTVYVKGARQRSEMQMGPGMTMTSVLQCDQKRIVQINDSCKVYMVAPTDEEESPAGAQPAAKPEPTPAKKTTRGGVLTFIFTTIDTNERKTMFGYQARHLKSNMKSESSPDACVKSDFRMEADGWYANLSVGLTCSGSAGMSRGAGGTQQPPDCQDRIRSRRTGPNPGFALQETRTMYSGGQTFTTTTETLELSKDPLDAALFEIPAGYREVKSQQELMCMGDMQSMMAKAMKGEMSQEEMEAAMASAGAAGKPAKGAGQAAMKSSGKLRIGVVGFVNQAQAPVPMESPRQRLIDEIIGMDVDAVPLDQETPEEITAEAREKKCDFILYTDVTKVKQAGGKLGGMFGKVTGGAAGAGKYEVAVNFRLFAIDDPGARLTTSAGTKGEGEASEVLASVMADEARQAVAEARRKK